MPESFSAPMATILVAFFTVVGVIIGHFLKADTDRSGQTTEVELKEKELDHSIDLAMLQNTHQIKMAEQEFVTDIIRGTLASGSADEQRRNLRAYAEMGLIAEPYSTKLLALNDRQLPSIERILNTPYGSEAIPVTSKELTYLAEVSNAVGLIQLGSGGATGTLIANQLLLTANHVLPNPLEAKSAFFEIQSNDLEDGNVSTNEIFNFLPDEFFLTSKELDYSIVAVSAKSRQGRSIEEFDNVTLSKRDADSKLIIGERVSLIFGSQNGERTILASGFEITQAKENVIWYSGSGGPGSSGGPIFSFDKGVVALHHAGWETNGDRVGEGIRTSAILADAEIQMKQLQNAEHKHWFDSFLLE